MRRTCGGGSGERHERREGGSHRKFRHTGRFCRATSSPKSEDECGDSEGYHWILEYSLGALEPFRLLDGSVQGKESHVARNLRALAEAGTQGLCPQLSSARPPRHTCSCAINQSHAGALARAGRHRYGTCMSLTSSMQRIKLMNVEKVGYRAHETSLITRHGTCRAALVSTNAWQQVMAVNQMSRPYDQ